MNWWDDNVTPVVMRPEFAGAVGALLGMLSAPGATLKQQAFNLLSGLAFAVFCAPLVAQWIGIKSESAVIGFSFLCGLIGMNLIAKLLIWNSSFDWGAFFSGLMRAAPTKPEDKP